MFVGVQSRHIVFPHLLPIVFDSGTHDIPPYLGGLNSLNLGRIDSNRYRAKIPLYLAYQYLAPPFTQACYSNV